MRARNFVLALLAAPLAAAALDAPHDLSSPISPMDCQACHIGHGAVGGSLTTVSGNANLCQSCHSPVSGGPTGHGFPWTDSDQASPGSTGTSHRWDAIASGMGATPPASGTEMGNRLDEGKITCSVCHDQHNNTGRVGGSQHTSYPVGAAQNPSSGGTGRTMTLGAVAASASPKGYLVQFVTAGTLTTARFKLSNDGGVSWRGCTAPTTYDWITTSDPAHAPTATSACQPGASVTLNDAANVTVGFATPSASFAAGDQWKFHVSYPFLRISNAAGEMCVSCHADRYMYWQDVEGGDANAVAGGRISGVALGTTVFHHPVGQALAKAYDHPSIVDATGVTQATGDGNVTNDLVTAAGGVVTCMTCHHPHNADSNSRTIDPR